MANAPYKLLLNGYIQIVDTGANCPASRATHIGNHLINELIAAGCATEDYDGTLSFTPDGVLLDAETAPVQTLASAKEEAYSKIDNMAGETRKRFITSVAGQEATYMAKADQATKYAAAGYDVTTISNYVWLVAECNSQKVAVTGDAVDSDAVKAVVDAIIAEQTGWYYIGSKIEEVRRTAKIKVAGETGTTTSKIAKAKTNILAHVAEADTLFKAI